MKRHSSLAIAVIATTLLAPSAIFAAPAIHSPVNAMFSKTKTIKFTLTNDSNATMDLKVGDDLVKLEPGKSVSVNLPLGARVVANSATPLHEAGSVIAEVSNSLSGAIIHIK